MDFAKLGLYAHSCSEWDGMVIDEFDPEFVACGCFQPTPEILAIQDSLAVEMDRLRGMLPPGDVP